ncbi:hypothetical protein GEOBRER4_n2140 [Citrifermentans bremense]|uniref:Curli production assembly/transport component CsgG n=1 Tax=Citrifermentans bremense TaxID=60035 RepID=A0A6S6M6T5_9BACT|nr:CsgG/HfaB family protein [Citrifermentans bremense]BCG47311.1 hypothetical protein GEOBRER4_n2140 [Citrifermentans bremense]
MGHRLITKAVLALAFAAVFGCAPPAGNESFQRGLMLQNQQRYEDALSMYEDALSKEPENATYHESYKAAKASLINKQLEGAKSQLAAGPADFTKLNSALSTVDKALALDPSNASAKALSSAIKSDLDAMVKKAEQLYGSATKAAEAKSWARAVENLTEISSFYPSYLDVSAKLPQVKEQAAAAYLKEAECLQASEDYSGALKALNTALQFQPDNQRLAALAEQVKGLHTPKNYLEKAQSYAGKGECILALDSMKKARELNPNQEILASIDRLYKETSSTMVSNIGQDLEHKNLFNAFNSYQSLTSFDPGAVKQPRVQELKDKLVAAMLERSDAYEEINRIGSALVWQEKALKLSASKEILQKTQGLKDKLRQRVVKKIALMDFTSPSTAPDAGRIVTDNLLSYLTRNSSGDIKILARDVLGTLLKEIELGQAGLYDIESAKKGGKLKGTDVFIFGSVLNYSVEKNVDEGQKMVNAVVGSKFVPNPAFTEWQNKYRNATDRDRPPAPAETVKEEIREIVKYKVATHKKTANVSVSFRVIDVEEGEVIITKTLKKKQEVSDTYSEGVEFAQIPFKELKLPSDTELLEQVVESIISELGYAVLSRFQNLQVLYSNSAEALKSKGDPEMVVERYMDAIIAEEIKNNPSQITEKARTEIEAQLKALSLEKPIDDLSDAEKASRQKSPQTKIPVAVKLPPDPAVLERPVAVAAPAPAAVPAPAAAPAPAPPVAEAAAPAAQ